MKNLFKKILAFCFLFLSVNAIKAQGTCTTAVTYSYPVTQTVTSYTASHYWFKVTTPNAGNYQLQISNGAGSGKITTANIYTGTCGSLTSYAVDSVFDASYTGFKILLVGTGSTTYYIDLVNNPASAITFSVTTIRQAQIGGQLSYLAGDNDTLKALVVGNSGTPSYTWNPGGLNTAQIVTTPTANTTYTLTS
ncbi:MAG: hypothetical protein ACXVDC_14545 [Bacteroidia bacterium]